MRSFRHWTPRYVVDRTRDLLYTRRNPQAPWLTPQATQILTTMLRPGDRGMEFGSGRSTLWLAARTTHLTSVDDDARWYGKVADELRARRVGNVDHVFAARDVAAERGERSEYARTVLRFADASLDFVLVDGAYRDACALLSLAKLRPGGLLIVDNVGRFLPSASRSPEARACPRGPATPLWSVVAERIAPWRHIWTTNGVWDSAIYVKPYAAAGERG
ncbi:class I SAM-dependent methyltransferase [Phytohabitans sp. ZYX-F-186]|uniref:Class I SAM-dependent methyltransferase n=1 Tax=Phytohabitans maris TaxID=3071409 RepID=A0ABU0ZME6_9ACTN|nr:class I SAM-dependent methyltransferase [Phytohabitans sp. ZYX-F-186]MDQ7908205.1 class I SAM-dependent methyltransferase [Phytohabitans sp. ZYX-F-186]